jgi:hypothetical protein
MRKAKNCTWHDRACFFAVVHHNTSSTTERFSREAVNVICKPSAGTVPKLQFVQDLQALYLMGQSCVSARVFHMEVSSVTRGFRHWHSVSFSLAVESEKVQHRLCQSPLLDKSLSHFHPPVIHTMYLPKMQFNVILPALWRVRFQQVSSSKFVIRFLSSSKTSPL